MLSSSRRSRRLLSDHPQTLITSWLHYEKRKKLLRGQDVSVRIKTGIWRDVFDTCAPAPDLTVFSGGLMTSSPQPVLERLEKLIMLEFQPLNKNQVFIRTAIKVK